MQGSGWLHLRQRTGRLIIRNHRKKGDGKKQQLGHSGDGGVVRKQKRDPAPPSTLRGSASSCLSWPSRSVPRAARAEPEECEFWGLGLSRMSNCPHKPLSEQSTDRARSQHPAVSPAGSHRDPRTGPCKRFSVVVAGFCSCFLKWSQVGTSSRTDGSRPRTCYKAVN